MHHFVCGDFLQNGFPAEKCYGWTLIQESLDSWRHTRPHTHKHTFSNLSVESIAHIQSFRLVLWELKDIGFSCNTLSRQRQNHSKCTRFQCSRWVTKKAERRILRRIWGRHWEHGEADANGRFVTDMSHPPFPKILQIVTLEEDDTDPLMSLSNMRLVFFYRQEGFIPEEKLNCTQTIPYSCNPNYVLLLSLVCKLLYPSIKHCFSQHLSSFTYWEPLIWLSVFICSILGDSRVDKHRQLNIRPLVPCSCPLHCLNLCCLYSPQSPDLSILSDHNLVSSTWLI